MSIEEDDGVEIEIDLKNVREMDGRFYYYDPEIDQFYELQFEERE